ncbi:uncharacterized protein Tco025E_01583 [Trypanosoma conorhini]|uniref:Uncharacterized protein n=1 Tax=Trypanosoma conorhini TaxID=83891 RepID=A0A3R7NZ84_9TRYP|nr:uncharacterized protein Tco025E_01583 [Trypanosoma conorhini]RNF26183.1 hypothetical protein Tco025E_01583 [Trypanosoma conorhini]
MRRPKSEDDTFADDLPPSVAVQYRILQKLLPGRPAACHQALSATDPPARRRATPHSAGGEGKRRRACTDPAQPPTVSSSSCCGGGRWGADAKAKALREIELGGPILDQLLGAHATHSRLEAAFEERWRDTWRTFAEFEARQRSLIEAMAGWFFEAFSPSLFNGMFRQLEDQAHRAAAAKSRVAALERKTEELWRYNKILEDRHGQSLRLQPLEDERDDALRENEEVHRALKASQGELRESRQTIAALRRQLREAETASKAPLRALTGEFEELKAQYRELVAAGGRAPPTTVAKAEERAVADAGEGRAPSVELLRGQVRELQHQLLLRDTAVGRLQQELAELRESARELGASQAEVQTLGPRLKAVTGPHPH